MRVDELLQRYRLLQLQRYQATVEARKEGQKPILRIGDRDPLTGQYQVIHPSGSVTTNGVKTFSASYPAGQVVRTTQAIGQPTVALDWKNAPPKQEFVRVEQVPRKARPRILALGNYYGFADSGYNSFPFNKTFALNIFNWLSTDRIGTRIATYSTDSLLAIGGDVSIDSDLYYSSLKADLFAQGFTLEAFDISDSDLSAILSGCDVFFLPNILSPSHQLDTAQANLLADFTRQGKGLFMVSYNIQEPYTGIYDVFGINSILTGGDIEYFPVDPAPPQVQPLVENVDFYTPGGVNSIYADPASPNTFYRLFNEDVLPEYNLGFVIELAD